MPELSLIRGVGVELEGASWPDGCCNEHWKRDPSVHVYADCTGPETDCRCGGEDQGELASNVLHSWPEVEAWVHENWPGTFDTSCGMHLHISTNLADYCRLMEPEFNVAYANAMLRFQSDLDRPDLDVFRPRFQGDNEFCYPDFTPCIGGGSERYVQLNFSAFMRHGTLECRVFPMFPGGPEVALGAIAAFLECVETYLATHDEIIEASATLEMNESVLAALEV